MPTYTCFAPTGRLSAEHKRAIAAAVTRVHHDATGAPPFYVQAVFVEVAAGDHFIGAAPIEGDQVFVQGQIRAGRTAQQKQTLITRLVAEVAEAAATEPFSVWVYLVELPPSQMAEFGRILPAAGTAAEARWLDEWPSEDRQRLERIGRG